MHVDSRNNEELLGDGDPVSVLNVKKMLASASLQLTAYSAPTPGLYVYFEIMTTCFVNINRLVS